MTATIDEIAVIANSSVTNIGTSVPNYSVLYKKIRSFAQFVFATSTRSARYRKSITDIVRHRTIKEVQYRLRHRSLLSTDYYVQLVTFESDDYNSANAMTIQEAQKLVEAGFEYVGDFDGDKLFRKKK